MLDEADRMLDMGFIHDVKRVIKLLPQKRQTLFFSATMPRDAADLAAAILNDPAQVAVAPVSATADRIEQSVYFVEKSDKRLLLSDLLRDGVMTRALVFSRTKHGANRVADYLSDRGIVAQAIHGNKSQNARERALAGFKTGAVRVLVATDIAARGSGLASGRASRSCAGRWGARLSARCGAGLPWWLPRRWAGAGPRLPCSRPGGPWCAFADGGGSDERYAWSPMTGICLRISRSMSAKNGRSSASQNDSAMPAAPARAVRPIRCTYVSGMFGRS